MEYNYNCYETNTKIKEISIVLNSKHCQFIKKIQEDLKLKHFSFAPFSSQSSLLNEQFKFFRLALSAIHPIQLI